jgi:hypothetical protein
MGIVVQFLSTMGHSQAKAVSPQGVMALLVVHSPLSIAQKPRFYSNNNYNPPSLLPSTYTTQGMGYPFSTMQSLEPSQFPPRLWCTQLARNLTIGDSRNYHFLQECSQ